MWNEAKKLLARKPSLRSIPKQTKIAYYSFYSKNQCKNKIQIYYNSQNQLIFNLTKNTNNVINAWIWNIEIEYFVEYLKLIYNFCMSEENDKNNNTGTIFTYIFKYDPDDVQINIQVKNRHKIWKYHIQLENNAPHKIKIILHENDLIQFLNSAMKLEN